MKTESSGMLTNSPSNWCEDAIARTEPSVLNDSEDMLAGYLQNTCRPNKCIGDDTKAAAFLKINNKKLNMTKNDFQYGGWNSYTLQYGTIMTLISPGDCTLQCGRWFWDDMPLNSSKRLDILEFYIWFRFPPYHLSRHVILHQSAKFFRNRTTLDRKK